MRSRRGFAAFAFGLLLVGTGFADEPKILDPQQAEAERRKLSERILENTQAARDQLAKSVTDATTQELQEGIVEDLTRLIELLRNSPPPPRGGSSSSQSDSDSSSQQDQESSRSKEESARRPPPGRAGTGKDRPKAEDSEERHGESKEGQALAERRRRLQSDIWGHLPPALREQLLNTYGERMLPQYEDFVRRFYEVLSEPKRPARR
jgi:acyl-CoA reductase-like NAD-dependent aldehyde dehydrogenase